MEKCSLRAPNSTRLGTRATAARLQPPMARTGDWPFCIARKPTMSAICSSFFGISAAKPSRCGVVLASPLENRGLSDDLLHDQPCGYGIRGGVAHEGAGLFRPVRQGWSNFASRRNQNVGNERYAK